MLQERNSKTTTFTLIPIDHCHYWDTYAKVTKVALQNANPQTKKISETHFVSRN